MTSTSIRSASIRRSAGGLLAACLALSCAAAIWMATAGSALAPEPARLNSTLYSTGSSTVIYVYSLASGRGYYLSSSWTPSSLPIGAPCSTTAPVPAGTVLTAVVQGSGSYRRCA